MRLTLKSIKTCAGLSEETIAFTATVYWGGKRIGEASNRGHGGPNNLRLNKWDRALYDEISEWCATQVDPEVRDFAVDCWIGDAVARFEEAKILKRQCRSRTVFLDANGEMFAYKCAFSEPVAEKILARDGKKFGYVECVNRRFAK